MQESPDTYGQRGCTGTRLGRPPLECRECEIICERVVSPWRCLRGNNNCVYAFEDGESTYFGCLHKVFEPELDLGVFKEHDKASGGRVDPYGPIRVVRAPRPQCPVSVERAYFADSAREQCVNPEFLREVFRVVRRPDEKSQGAAGRDDGSSGS
jgi:hypothetical protein